MGKRHHRKTEEVVCEREGKWDERLAGTLGLEVETWKEREMFCTRTAFPWLSQRLARAKLVNNIRERKQLGEQKGFSGWTWKIDEIEITGFHTIRGETG